MPFQLQLSLALRNSLYHKVFVLVHVSLKNHQLKQYTLSLYTAISLYETVVLLLDFKHHLVVNRIT